MSSLLWPLALLGCVTLHWLFSFWTGMSATPQFALVATVVVGVLRGPAAGESFGFCSGLLLDALGAHLFGANALVQTLIGYGVGRLRRQMDASLPPPQMAVVFLLSWAQFAALGLLGTVFLGRFQGRWLHGLLLVPVYNALLAPFAFMLLAPLRQKEGYREGYEP